LIAFAASQKNAAKEFLFQKIPVNAGKALNCPVKPSNIYTTADILAGVQPGPLSFYRGDCYAQYRATLEFACPRGA
jgi:hypothetical protein